MRVPLCTITPVLMHRFFVLFVVILMIVGTSYDYWVYLPTMAKLPKKRVSLTTTVCPMIYTLQDILLEDGAPRVGEIEVANPIQLTKAEYTEQVRK